MTLSTRAAIAALAATLVAVTVPAGVAHAGEAGYLARLGVDYDYNLNAETMPAALKVGYLLCDEMRAGTPREQLTATVYFAIPNATPDQAGGMVFAAHQELCPDADPDGHGI